MSGRAKTIVLVVVSLVLAGQVTEQCILSSALDARYHRPDGEPLGGSVYASTLDAGVTAGASALDGRFGWTLGVRKARASRFFGTQELKGTYDPDYTDLQGTFAYQISPAVELSAVGLWHHLRGTLFEQRWLLWIFVFGVLGPYAANQLGWVAAEVGRQPWTVYGLLRTEDSVSTNLVAGEVLTSIIGFGVIYLLLFLVWILVLNDKIQKGPEPVALPGTTTPETLADVATGQARREPGFSMTRGEQSGTTDREP